MHQRVMNRARCGTRCSATRYNVCNAPCLYLLPASASRKHTSRPSSGGKVYKARPVTHKGAGNTRVGCWVELSWNRAQHVLASVTVVRQRQEGRTMIGELGCSVLLPDEADAATSACEKRGSGRRLWISSFARCLVQGSGRMWAAAA